MRQVYKYLLKYATGIEQIVMMPIHSRIVSIRFQYGKPTLWVQVDAKMPQEPRRFVIYATGSPIDDMADYVGSVFEDGDHANFVWHIYELKGQGQ